MEVVYQVKQIRKCLLLFASVCKNIYHLRLSSLPALPNCSTKVPLQQNHHALIHGKEKHQKEPDEYDSHQIGSRMMVKRSKFLLNTLRVYLHWNLVWVFYFIFHFGLTSSLTTNLTCTKSRRKNTKKKKKLTKSLSKLNLTLLFIIHQKYQLT